MKDYRRLKEEADIARVVEHLGIKTAQKGSAYFILCPNPEHDDKHATNCYFKRGWNNVYCRACGKSTNAIELIIAETGMEFADAAEELWRISGCPSWFSDEEDFQRRKRPDFRLSREEAEIIGIHFPGRLLTPVNEDLGKEELPAGYEYGPVNPEAPQYYLRSKVNLCTYRDFISEEEYIDLIIRKAMECKRNTIEIKRMLKALHKNAGGQESLLDAAEWKIQFCNRIIRRAKKAEKRKKEAIKKAS